ncbi:MAG TPA: NIPSNAP family protein [Dehalococcoidia bacterium]|nr:NIPSNAP family protein [Dehalococcoidia bacterium]MDP7212907.1 NIPSNAP family protein [Dehalococcoidia bacterium]MDP7514705.1 NIPSNAP family protein [Dehalococcoidia bacterium]HJM52687.1 NIPSNAP family protein [Dehalococcoidia bacterium]
MIHEFRTYDLKPGSIGAYIHRVADVIEERQKLSPLVGYFYTEIGRLNRVLHIWQYDSVEHRNEMRAAAVAGGNWPPKTHELIEHQYSEIFVPATFLPPLEIERKIGPIFEMRAYTLQPQTTPAWMEAWGQKIKERMELSQPVGIWTSELGQLNRWWHMWSYESWEHRTEARKKFAEIGWPPSSGSLPMAQENMLYNAMPFSPVQ